MKYTVTEIAEMVGKKNVLRVEQQGRYVTITVKGGLKARKCDHCKTGEHVAPGVAPRIKIRTF